MSMNLKPYTLAFASGLVLVLSCADRPGFGDDKGVVDEMTDADGGDMAAAEGPPDAAGAGGLGTGEPTASASSTASGEPTAGASSTASGEPMSGAGGAGGGEPMSGAGGAGGGEPGGDVVICEDGETRCGTDCADTRASAAHCGGCEQPCSAEEVCSGGNCQASCESPLEACDGACVDVSSDAAHCGDCDEACPIPEGGMATCTLGTCGIECDGTTACGDECVNTQASAQHCGDCDEACEEDEVCDQGMCATSCEAPLSACDGACVDLDTDADHCGECDEECPVPSGGTASCSDGSCEIECDELTACQDACVDTDTDEDHCGGCQNPCAGECVDGSCCPADREVCDGTCVNLDTSAAHCGECGNDCASGEVCEDGDCLVNCTSGERCGDDCVNLSTDLENCQSCGTECAAPAANGSAVCTATGCDIECNANSLPCGSTCCNPPASARVEATCNSNTCGVQCTTGNHDCTGGSPSECYADNDPLKCGDACTNCTQPYATAACVAGQCNNTCADGPDLGCEDSTGKPVCGFWSFETSSTSTEGWFIDTAQSGASTGVFSVTTQHATHGTRSLAAGYQGIESDYGFTVKIELCPTGLAGDLSAWELVFDLRTVSSDAPFDRDDSNGYIVWRNGTSQISADGCDFKFDVGANLGLSCALVPSGQVTSLEIHLRVYTAWTGTYYLDNIRFE
jgi:hypothetical protein